MPYANNPPVRLKRFSHDGAIIIGAGLAGLFTALKLAPLPVTIICPKPLGQGASSAWAQGGIAAALGEGDTPQAHARDTIIAGCGLSDPAIAQLLAEEASDRIDDLLRYGVPFDRDLEGKLNLSREAAHSMRRIVRVNGDQAGRAIMAALITAVSLTPSISVLENVEAIDLHQSDGRIDGVYVKHSSNRVHISLLPAQAVILATGGIGQLYDVTTNPKEACASGFAMAARAGAILADAEFVQFHPTAFDIGLDPAPLASEALRGDGALLINRDGRRFMLDVHPDGELAPRDVVARGVANEIANGRGAFLDCTMLNLEKQFPNAFSVTQSAGIDARNQPIPIAHAAHYHMGGVYCDARGRSSLSGLWVCGEVACTTVHGANRLASNSLLEAIVFGARIAEDIAGEAIHWYVFKPDLQNKEKTWPAFNADKDRQLKTLRYMMTRFVGVQRTGQDLLDALRHLSTLPTSAGSHKMQSMILASQIITSAALDREESRGSQYRTDFPDTSKHWNRHSFYDLSRLDRKLREHGIVRNQQSPLPHKLAV